MLIIPFGLGAPAGSPGPPLVEGTASGRGVPELKLNTPLGPIEVTPVQLITSMREIHGWASGLPTDSEDTLRFCEMTGVRPMIEKFPLEKAAEAYQQMITGRARFRVVLTMEQS